MTITDKKYFSQYCNQIGDEIPCLIEDFDFSEGEDSFLYLTKASAVYSSNIEGNSIDLNSFMNQELREHKFKLTKEFEEIENLIVAYQFAQNNRLSEASLLTCHKESSKTLLIKSKQGAYREEPVGVFGRSGLIYLAVEPEFVKKEMDSFFDEITELLSKQLTTQEVFYFASLIHLKFVHIHPFMDGNGRIARLLEKWFIAEQLGQKYWSLPLEEYYKNHQKEYYSAINLGVNYYTLDYGRCLSFLTLSPSCLRVDNE